MLIQTLMRMLLLTRILILILILEKMILRIPYTEADAGIYTDTDTATDEDTDTATDFLMLLLIPPLILILILILILTRILLVILLGILLLTLVRNASAHKIGPRPGLRCLTLRKSVPEARKWRPPGGHQFLCKIIGWTQKCAI